MKNRLYQRHTAHGAAVILTFMIIGIIKLGICMEPPPPPPPATPDSAPTATAVPAAIGVSQPPAQDFGVPASRFGWKDAGAPELDENKRGLTDSGNNAILTLFAQGSATIQAMDTVLTQMGNAYVDASRKFFDADTTIDTVYQQASFNLGVLQQVTQRAATAGKQAQASLTAEQQASVTEINKTLESIKQNKTALNQIFSQINDTIGQGKTLASQARQKNLQILQLPDAAAGKSLMEEIQKLSQDLNQLSDQLQNAAVKNFNTTCDQISTSAQTINGLIQKLQTKSFSLQVAQEQQQQKMDQQTQQQAAAKQPASFVSWFIEEEKPTAPTTTEPTVIHYLFKRAADALTYCINLVYKGYVYLKELVINAWSSKPAVQQKPAVAPQAQQTPTAGTPTPTPPTTVPAGTPPATAPQEPGIPTPPQETTPPVPATTPPPAMPQAMPQTMPSYMPKSFDKKRPLRNLRGLFYFITYKKSMLVLTP
jgi:hypothetical protein